MKCILWTSLLATALALCVQGAAAEERFPPPDFESGYEMPVMTRPAPRAVWREVTDVAVLAAALVAATVIALRLRSRRAMTVLSVFSLAYFGFYRMGCICPVGSVQHAALSLFDRSYAIPLTVAVIFALPLLFALLFGRVFCGGVCPLGAVQDLVLLRPVRLPRWLEGALGVLPYVYLGLAVMYALNGAGFVICAYDPFVSFFRLSGPWPMLALGGAFVATSVFVGRPYCRFLCPYGVLLRLCSRWAWRKVSITPDECVVCSLCEDACPFGAIHPPTPQGVDEP